MTVKDLALVKDVPDGTALMIGITYGDTPKVFTYVALKAGSFWYLTGGGRTPQAAGWGAVKLWLSKDDREVQWVRVLTEGELIWTRAEPVEAGPPLEIAQDMVEPDHPCSVCQCGSDECPGVQVHQR